MNLKLHNDVRDSGNAPPKAQLSIKEERRRTGRYIAILVGISLLLLAIYHAWVRRIPVVASLVVPALIMFIYVGWVLYTASRDKHRLLDAEAAMQAALANTSDNDVQIESMANSIEISVICNKQISNGNTPTESTHNDWSQISSALLKGESNIRIEDDVLRNHRLIKPIILINDKPPDDTDQNSIIVVEALPTNSKTKALPAVTARRKFKRRFCRSRRHAAFKRSYSIA